MLRNQWLEHLDQRDEYDRDFIGIVDVHENTFIERRRQERGYLPQEETVEDGFVRSGEDVVSSSSLAHRGSARVEAALGVSCQGPSCFGSKLPQSGG